MTKKTIMITYPMDTVLRQHKPRVAAQMIRDAIDAGLAEGVDAHRASLVYMAEPANIKRDIYVDDEVLVSVEAISAKTMPTASKIMVEFLRLYMIEQGVL